jgi:phytoene dehydrogenase-like protein
MKADIAIVGAGLTGLVAAAKLAGAGRDVVVLERGSRVGGRARSTDVGPLAMNLGPHALYRGGRAWRALADVGVTASGFVPDGKGAVLTWHGEVHGLPGGALSLATSKFFSFSDKLDLGRVLAGPERLARRAPGGSAADFIAQATDSERVAAFLTALVRVSTYTNAPGQLDGAAAATQLARVFRSGVLYVDGGWQWIVDAVETAAAMRGAVFRHARVTAVDASGRVSVEGGDTLTAQHVLLALPAAGVRALAPHLAPPPDAISSRAACLDLVVDGLPHPARRFALGIDEPHYFSVHSRPGATGPTRVQVARYLAPDDPGDRARDALVTWLDLVQPGLRDRVIAERFLPDMTVQSAIPTVRSEARPLVDGSLRAAGDHAAAGFLLDASLESVDNVCAEIAAALPRPRAA